MDRLRVLALVVAAVSFVALLALAFFEDAGAAPLNLLTEGTGVVAGAVLTVLGIEGLRTRREARADRARRDERLSRELARNLARMVTRREGKIYPRHVFMAASRYDTALSFDDLAAEVDIPLSSATGLAQTVFLRARASTLSLAAIEDAIVGGEYITSPGLRDSDSNPIHRALERIREDVRHLAQFDEPESGTFQDWHVNLVASVTHAARNKLPAARVEGRGLAAAFVVHDLSDNIFWEQVALLRVLSGADKALQPTVRRDPSPFGQEEADRASAEGVDAEEVLGFLTEEMYPFGEDPFRALFRKDEPNRDEKARRFAEDLVHALEVDPSVAPDVVNQVVSLLLEGTPGERPP